jgi:hypothetical protein
MIGDERCRYAEGADVLRDDDPAFSCSSLEHASIISSAKPRPVSSYRHGIETVSRKVLGEPARVVLIQQEPELMILR